MNSTKRALLTKNEAEERSKLIRDVTYNLLFDLEENKKDFTGKVEIVFKITGVSVDAFFIDFLNGTIQSLKVNRANTAYDYDGTKILISHEILNVNRENRIEIVFSHKFSDTGDGLHRFQDPFDGKVYIYTNLEPYDANAVFPCFDQPDIKATYTVMVKAPMNWQIISNEKEVSVREEEDRRIWEFPEVKGQASEGTLKGESLAPINHFDVMWFAWSAFYPETELIQ